MNAVIQRKPSNAPQDEEQAAWTEGIIEYLQGADRSGCFHLGFSCAFGEILDEATADVSGDPLTVEIMIDDPDFLFTKQVNLGEMLMDICSDGWSERSAQLSKLFGQRLRELADKIDPGN